MSKRKFEEIDQDKNVSSTETITDAESAPSTQVTINSLISSDLSLLEKINEIQKNNPEKAAKLLEAINHNSYLSEEKKINDIVKEEMVKNVFGRDKRSPQR